MMQETIETIRLTDSQLLQLLKGFRFNFNIQGVGRIQIESATDNRVISKRTVSRLISNAYKNNDKEALEILNLEKLG